MDDKANLDEFNKMLTATGLPPMTQEELDEFYDDVAQFEKVVDDLPHIEPSVRYKREMNRFFRERIGAKKIPHPDADNAFERFRSWVVIKLHLEPYDPKREHRKNKRA